MIDEKKLIEELDKNSIFKKITNAGDETVYDIIDRLPKVGEWIPIRFRETTDEDGFDKEEHPIMLECTLPDNGEEALVTTKLGHVLEDTFYDDDGAYFESCEWDEVTAWMPLPEPYKEGVKE